MNEVETLRVDLTDPADVAAQLPRARQMASEFREQASALVEKADSWDRLVHVLETLVRADKPESAAKHQHIVASEALETLTSANVRRATTGDMIVGILSQAGGPVPSAEFRKLMPDTPPNTLNWKLSEMARDGKIQRIRPGLYAPLGYERDQVSLPTGHGGQK